MINEKEVSESTRQFLQNWYANKEARKQLRKQSKERAESIDVITSWHGDRDTLEQNYPYSLDTVYDKDLTPERLPNSKHLMKHHKQFVEVLAKARRNKPLPPLEQSKPRYVCFNGINLDIFLKDYVRDCGFEIVRDHDQNYA